MFSKLLQLFNLKNEIDANTEYLKEVQLKLDVLEKKITAHESLMLDHHKTIATIAIIQANMLADIEKTLSGSKRKTQREKVYSFSSKDDEFMN